MWDPSTFPKIQPTESAPSFALCKKMALPKWLSVLTARTSTSSDDEAGARASKMASASTWLVLPSVFIAYCLSGTLLTLSNKTVMMQFPYPTTTVAIQNAVAVLLLVVGAAVCPALIDKPPALQSTVVKRWLPLVILFVVMLSSSLKALMHVSAVTLIVIRNLTSLSVAVLDFVARGTRISSKSALSLAGMLVGAVLYGLHDIAFSPAGYAWLILNILATTSYQVYAKSLVSLENIKHMGPTGFAYLNNLLSLPVLILISVASGEWTAAARDLSTQSAAYAGLLVTGLLGFCLSVTGFKLNTLISATSMMVANNVNKVGTPRRARAPRGGPQPPRCTLSPVTSPVTTWHGGARGLG